MTTYSVSGGITIPEDEGTDVPEGTADYISAGHLGGLVGRSNATQYVERGLDLSYNSTAQTATLGRGHAFILSDRDADVQDSDGNYSQVWRENQVVVCHVPEFTVDIVVGEVNYIYLSPDHTVNNGIQYVVEQAPNSPSGPSLLVGVVDEPNGTKHETHREPRLMVSAIMVKNTVERGETITVPEGYTAIMPNAQIEGEIVGNGDVEYL